MENKVKKDRKDIKVFFRCNHIIWFKFLKRCKEGEVKPSARLRWLVDDDNQSDGE